MDFGENDIPMRVLYDKALYLFLQGEFKNAIYSLECLVEVYEEQATMEFYLLLGVCYC